jgi:NTP pyrophosphatase (non-canonical NTP hydrolase)
MPQEYELMIDRALTLTDEAVEVLKKNTKSLPKDEKKRKDLQKNLGDTLDGIPYNLDKACTYMVRALNDATDLLDEVDNIAEKIHDALVREIVRKNLKVVLKMSKDFPRPKGWADNHDKAAKELAGWDAAAGDVPGLVKCMKLLEAAKKNVQTQWKAFGGRKRECVATIGKAMADLATAENLDRVTFGSIRDKYDEFESIML